MTTSKTVKEFEVLIVDDDDSVRDWLFLALNTIGVVNIKKEDSGIKVLENFSGACKDVDLIISDINMPGLTGFDMAKQLLEQYPFCPPICFFTGELPSKERKSRKEFIEFSEYECDSLLRTVSVLKRYSDHLHHQISESV